MTQDTQLEPLFSFDPHTGRRVYDPVAQTTSAELAATVERAALADATWAQTPRRQRASCLEAIAAALDAAAPGLVDTAMAESGLPSARLTGEVSRTTGQLRMFADVIRDGGYLGAIICPHDAARNQPDVRRVLRPIGPVGVFSASNFPFAFSVAGGDTASALAAGSAVVVKAHEGHPRTSAQVAAVVRQALHDAGAPTDILQVVYGKSAGSELVRHPAIRAVGFTGSLAGGRALFDIASGRPDPIPFFGELGSINPVVVLPSAAQLRRTELADGYAASLTLGSGQFCTNPGVIFVPDDAALLTAIADAVGATTVGPLLTERIHDGFQAAVTDEVWASLPLLASGTSDGAWSVPAQIRRASLDQFHSARDILTEERFGPAGLVVTYSDASQLLPVLTQLPGSLTASVHAEDGDAELAAPIAEALSAKVGRLIWNGWPTGVAVSWAMHHGGPWPASTAASHTSVGATAIARWLRPIAYQDWPQSLLPEELLDDNPTGVLQLRR
ncbi:aldehyde dehydrogenase (NADP(+)) [Sphaerisporangium perillae]|uniref:aldehyde dehydrogenase (NADP(+)) n=1 Tax=Sphaerisporangium perillae TaxID=2935860 RepID=UPI0020105C80|nr:aldehyde dehydrogenase (NADP(+)) [Sphaerisporangium perillae]